MNPEPLPQWISTSRFESAISEFGQAIGSENVWVDKKDLARLVSFLISEKIDAHMPSAALFPQNVAEVVRIVKICNRCKVPLWTSSTGRNIAYGSMAPVKPGTVILSLRRMNRIVTVDPELCYAVVEPGVTYQQLYDHLHAKGYRLRLNIPSGLTHLAGPVGTCLDRGVGYAASSENFENVCGLEVVLADGEILRTGMGGITDTTSWHAYKWGYGPYLDGIFTQSNYGICTRMGLWLMPEPPASMAFAVTCARHEDLSYLVDTLRPLKINRIVANGVIAPDDGSEAFMGAWNIYGGLDGTPEQIQVYWDIANAAFAGRPGVNCYSQDDLGDSACMRMRVDLMTGVVKKKAYFKWGPSNWFAPIVPMQGRHAQTQVRLAREIIGRYGFSHELLFIVGDRWMHNVMLINYRRGEEAELRLATECYLELVKAFARHGYGVYRTSIAHMDAVAETYGPGMQRVFRKIKTALDPNGILSPGKSGIDVV